MSTKGLCTIEDWKSERNESFLPNWCSLDGNAPVRTVGRERMATAKRGWCAMEERNECDCMRERIHYMDTYVLFLVWQGWIGSYAMNPHVRVYCIDYRYRALSILYRKFSVDPCQIQNNMFSFRCDLSLHLNICSSFLTRCETSPNRWYMYEYIVHTLVDIGACGYIVCHIY